MASSIPNFSLQSVLAMIKKSLLFRASIAALSLGDILPQV
jgi:hypothetical protein